MKVLITGTVLFCVCSVIYISCQSGSKENAGLYFREDWKETPAEIPVTQMHVKNPELILARHGASADSIKKSHHDQPDDDPWYVWSGLCTTNWAVTLQKKNSLADLTSGARISWRTKQAGGRILRIVLGLENGTWLVSDQGSGVTADWHVFTIGLDTLKWRRLDIETVEAGERLQAVDLSKVQAIGCTDLMPGGGSPACSRLDWIEVYGRAVR